MLNQEIVNEIDENRKLILEAPNDPRLNNQGVIDTITLCSANMLDLIRLLIRDGEVEYSLAVAKEIKGYLTQILEFTSGMNMRDLNDYMIANKNIDRRTYDLYWEVVKEEAFYIFESFVDYMEKNRLYCKKFYAPRRYTKSGKPSLKLVADELQNLEYRKYKFLGVSLPSRTGKSTICIFYLCWKALRNPNSHSAMGGHAGTLVKGFYKELLNLMTSSEYTFEELYKHFHPASVLIRDKSAEDYTITLDEPDRFATITCRGIDATWTGAVDVSWDGVLYVDDLVRDRQHSLSPNRMEETFQEYLNKMVDRKSGFDPFNGAEGTFAGATELMVGTLWNVLDPLERLRAMYNGNPLYKFLRIPALDENDESNFDYEYNGFTTEYYRDMRTRLDSAEWQSKYQQSPYVREGLLFPAEELRYSNGIIYRDEIKKIFAICDPAFGGGDNLSMPICIETNNGRKTIVRWIFDRRTLRFTIPRILDAIQQLSIAELRLEKNGAGLMLENAIKEEMKKRNINGCKISSVSAPNRMSKEDKIKGYSDYIKENFEFLIPNNNAEIEVDEDTAWYFKRDSDYQSAMDNMHMYTSEGKNPHDDAPDSMSQMAIMCEKRKNGQVTPLHIPDGFGF